MRRSRRTLLAAILGAFAFLSVHACGEDVTAPDGNQAPDTEVWASSPEIAGDEFSIDFVFTGMDAEGEVKAFDWRVLEDPAEQPEWTRTASGELTMVFPLESGFEAPGIQRTLEVRAVDASGLVDPTPAEVGFSPLTLAPEVAITMSTHPLSCRSVGRAPTFAWTGTDADAKSGTPEFVRYLFKQYGDAGQPCLLEFDYQSGAFPISTTDPGWSDWIPYDAPLDAGRIARLPVLPVSAVGSSYLFAVQVRDIHGATSRNFDWGEQVAHVKVSATVFPYMTVTEPTLGADDFYGPGPLRPYEINPGQELQFSWTANADAYFGEVEDFRFGWDLLDPDDPEDPGWEVDWGEWTEAPARSFLVGSHSFVAQVRDRAGAITRATYLLTLGEPTGVPELQFRLFADVGAGIDPVWELRWVGDGGGPAPESPEQTSMPFAGFGRRFKIEWEATSPNGEIVGYRYRAEQGSDQFTPPDVEGEKQWDPSATSFVFGNDTPPAELGPGCGEGAVGCDPALVRFESGNYGLAVEALDAAQVESGPGILEFAVNYEPETELVFESVYPRFEVRDALGTLLESGPVAEGDTIPAWSTVFLRSSGYDKFFGDLPPGVPSDSLCCDEPLFYDPALDPSDPAYVPPVKYQSRLVTVRREGDDPVGRTLSNVFSSPDASDTISFWAGPLDYTYQSRTVDEHRRPDRSAETLDFVAGFPPRVRKDLSIPGGDVPGGGGDVADTLVISLAGVSFPENEIPYTVLPAVQKWWVPDETEECGGRLEDYVEGDPAPDGGVLQLGAVVSISLKFVGEQDPRDPLSPVKAWSFALFSDRDPDNLIEDGLESHDLNYFVDSPLPNEWEFGPAETIDVWVPYALGVGPTEDYAPDSTDPVARSVGCLVAKRLGDMTLRLRGRTTGNPDEYLFYQGTRKTESGSATSVSIGEFGRQSPESVVNFWFFVGGTDPMDLTVPSYYWPDF